MHALNNNYSAVDFPHFTRNISNPDRAYPLHNVNNFCTGRMDISIVQKRPLIEFPTLWNSLDQNYKDISSHNLFGRNYKKCFT